MPSWCTCIPERRMSPLTQQTGTHVFLVCPSAQSSLYDWTSLRSPSKPMTSLLDTCTNATARRQVCMVPKNAGFSIPKMQSPGPSLGTKCRPPAMVDTLWASLGRSFGAIPTREGLDPNERLYQVGVGPVQSRHRRDSLVHYW